MSDPDVLRRAGEVKERVAPRLMAIPGVTGVGVGYRNVGGRRTEEVAIRVYVARKRPLAELPPSEVIPERIDGVRVDVIEARFSAQSNGGPTDPAEHRQRHDPMLGGISVGRLDTSGVGTLGGWAVDHDTGELVLVSNWHVLCGRLDCAAGDEIVQPGRGDGGGEDDVVARLHRAVISERVDAATARLTGSRALLQTALGLGPIADVAEPVLGLPVRKSGSTTGVTSGLITDPSATLRVCDYPFGDPDPGCPSGISRLFVNQIVIEGEGVSAPGDSGSFWIDDANWIVGLHYAGAAGVLAAANPMLTVLEELRISIGLSIVDLVAVGNITR